MSRKSSKHRRGAAGHAVDHRVAVVGHLAARCLDPRLHQAVGVDHADAHGGLAVLWQAPARARWRRARPPPGCCRSSARRPHAPRPPPPAGTGSPHRCRPPSDGPTTATLLVKRRGAADAVDLPRVGRAHDAEEQRIPRRRVRGQVGRQEIGALRRAAAHPGAGQGVDHATPPRPKSRGLHEPASAADQRVPGSACGRPGWCAMNAISVSPDPRRCRRSGSRASASFSRMP